jgi:hypothetical protein
METLAAQANSTDALKGHWGEWKHIVVEPKRAVVSRKLADLRKQVKPKKRRRK